MTLAETIYQHSLRLPEPAAREALDFIERLERRYGIVAPAAASLPTREAVREQALAELAEVRIRWNGKPIADRDALYDDARGAN
jgi:hypothetical protein